MTFRSIGILCVVVAAALGLATWTAAPRVDRADFVYVNPSDVNTLDPAQMSWTQDIRLAINLWEGLTAYDPRTTEPIAGAAEFPPDISPDGTVYIFSLRPDGRWSNGDRVTARDLVRGWRRAIEPGTAADYSSFLTDHVAGASEYVRWRSEAIDQFRLSGGDAALRRHAEEMETQFAAVGVRAIDDLTLEVRLSAPCPFFLDLCAFPTLLPIHESIELLRERYMGLPITEQGLVVYDPQWTKPDYHRHGYPGLVTDGPYRIESWSFKQRLRMAVNPHYRDAATIACRTIDMLVIGQISTALLAYEAGEVDFLPDLSVPFEAELVRRARSGERPDFHCPLVFGTYSYNFNCRAELPDGPPNPLADARVRRAFALAVDKRALVEHVTRRGEPVAATIIPPDMIPGYVSPTGLTYDPVAARKLLSEAGYPDGRGLPPIDLLYNTDFSHERICQAMARMWRETLSVAVELRGLETKTFGAEKAAGRFMIARGGWYGDYLDPTTFLDVFETGNGNNDSGFTNAAYDELLGQARRHEGTKARRSEILAEAERMLVEEHLPVLPLYVYPNLMAIKPHVRGLQPNPRLIFPFRYISIEAAPCVPLLLSSANGLLRSDAPLPHGHGSEKLGRVSDQTDRSDINR